MEKLCRWLGGRGLAFDRSRHNQAWTKKMMEEESGCQELVNVELELDRRSCTVGILCAGNVGEKTYHLT